MSGLTALRQTAYLRLLAVIVLLGATMQSLLDYALGSEATVSYGGGARLLAFFAIFQTVVGILSFLVQISANRLALERLGVGGTMALLPGGVVALGALVLGAPSLLTVALQKGAESLLRASLFRSAYEVLFTPIAPALKRPTKTMIDVSFDRIGLMAGSVLTLGLIALIPRDAVRAVIAVTVVAAAIQLVVAYRLHHGYVRTLTDRLRSGALVLDAASLVDATTRRTLSQTMESLDRPTLLARIEALRASGETFEAPAPLPEHPELETSPADEAVQALADVVLDSRRPSSGAAARGAPAGRRVVAAGCVGPRARPRRTEDLDVRYACGRALVAMREKGAELRFDPVATRARARHELEAASEGRARDARMLEHSFNVLSLTFPREAMQLAYGAIVAGNPFLRGVALEYLDAVLPADLRAALTPRLDSATPPRTSAARPSSRALDELLRSKDAIELSLEEIRRAHDLDGGTPS